MYSVCTCVCVPCFCMGSAVPRTLHLELYALFAAVPLLSLALPSLFCRELVALLLLSSAPSIFFPFCVCFVFPSKIRCKTCPLLFDDRSSTSISVYIWACVSCVFIFTRIVLKVKLCTTKNRPISMSSTPTYRASYKVNSQCGRILFFFFSVSHQSQLSHPRSHGGANA